MNYDPEDFHSRGMAAPGQAYTQTMPNRPSLDYLDQLPLSEANRTHIKKMIDATQGVIDRLLPGSYLALVTPEPPKLPKV